MTRTIWKYSHERKQKQIIKQRKAIDFHLKNWCQQRAMGYNCKIYLNKSSLIVSNYTHVQIVL